jgi:hypothetical protein
MTSSRQQAIFRFVDRQVVNADVGSHPPWRPVVGTPTILL